MVLSQQIFIKKQAITAESANVEKSGVLTCKMFGKVKNFCTLA